MTNVRSAITFNSPLESGVRSVAILFMAYPSAYDLQRLVAFDYLIVHSGDVGGPASLHPQLPLRSTELLVRRNLIERSLLLMISRGLVERITDASGISYRASEMAGTFVSSLTSPYLIALQKRGAWVVNTFGNLTDLALKKTMNDFFGHWIEEFQATQRNMEGA